MATGGNPKAGMFYEVNEKGPELLSVAGKDYLMMGNQDGRITPNHRLGGGGRQVTVINNVNVAPVTDRRTADQVAQRAAEKTRAAVSRNS